MFTSLFGKSRSHEIPQQLYGTVVAQARQPVFFTDYGFEDSVTGRFDVLALHLFLLSRRLVREDSNISKSLNQEVFDYFTADTDRALRELGIGDTSVPKRKKKMIRTFYALVDEFAPAMDQADTEAVKACVCQRYNGPEQTAKEHEMLANYLNAAAGKLDEIAMEDILKGRIAFPDAAVFS